MKLLNKNELQPYYECDICGTKTTVWQEGWQWYGKLEVEYNNDRLFTCSDRCRNIIKGKEKELLKRKQE